MDTPTPDVEPRHPIGVVVRRTGIPQDLLRAWERRYRAVIPGRSETGRRLYSDADVIKLRLLKRVVDGGRRISDVARLGLAELQTLVAEDATESLRPDREPALGALPSGLLAESLGAIHDLDRRRLEHTLNEAAVRMSGPSLRQKLIVPLMHAIGERWRDGVMRISQEHMATSIVRRFVDTLRNGGGPVNGPKMIVTTPAGQLHELGALMVAAAAEESGWQVSYLGPNLPAEEIASAARQIEARVVSLSLIYATDERDLTAEIRRVRALLDPAVQLIVGGRAFEGMELDDPANGIRHLGDLTDFQSELDRLAAGP